MSRSSYLRLAGAAVLALTASCATNDGKPAEKNVASGGDVAPAAAPTPGAANAALADSISMRADLGRIRGAESAPIWLIEVSDFQCPYCKQWHDETFEKLDKEFVKTGKVRLTYYNHPIASLHPNAKAAAEAAMCASAQGKFWELHTSLFVAQQKWAGLPNPTPVFDSLATAAGVNAPAWRSCVSAHATSALIDADLDRSTKSGAQSTPTFFIGNKTWVTIAGAYPVDSFRVIINKQLAASGAPK
ncbi:MAG: thioredoxin domain-containing protein [Gemmatimonadota bacterium]